MGAKPLATEVEVINAATARSTSLGSKTVYPLTVAAIEYDPNRTCRIALLHYHDGEKRYILAPRGVQPGDLLLSGKGC